MNEHGRDSIQSVFMGKESAKQLLLNVEELMSKWSLGQFVTAFREGDTFS